MSTNKTNNRLSKAFTVGVAGLLVVSVTPILALKGVVENVSEFGADVKEFVKSSFDDIDKMFPTK